MYHVHLCGQEVGDHAVQVLLPPPGVQQPACHLGVRKLTPGTETTPLYQGPK
ncbi:hypothetical protein DPMN_050278 [Dreissena polymorpha]|uniref:Uncharacterized protein n=1 Tax=Dreissena polymorpha TaxID=45954 RepID=A0A9D4CHP5_DREPO|nr:hypothetical protein DPMN_050278 [Dreissena polymorpha]